MTPSYIASISKKRRYVDTSQSLFWNLITYKAAAITVTGNEWEKYEREESANYSISCAPKKFCRSLQSKGLDEIFTRIWVGTHRFNPR
jgi:hypothetical protein